MGDGRNVVPEGQPRGGRRALPRSGAGGRRDLPQRGSGGRSAARDGCGPGGETAWVAVVSAAAVTGGVLNCLHVGPFASEGEEFTA